MQLTINKVWPRKSVPLEGGKSFMAQNIYATEGVKDVVINATGVDDLSYLDGKIIELSGTIATGFFTDKKGVTKKSIKVTKETVINIVEPLGKAEPETVSLTGTYTPPTTKTEPTEQKCSTGKERLLELYTYFTSKGVPCPEAQGLASTIFIQENRK